MVSLWRNGGYHGRFDGISQQLWEIGITFRMIGDDWDGIGIGASWEIKIEVLFRVFLDPGGLLGIYGKTKSNIFESFKTMGMICYYMTSWIEDFKCTSFQHVPLKSFRMFIQRERVEELLGILNPYVIFLLDQIGELRMDKKNSIWFTNFWSCARFWLHFFVSSRGVSNWWTENVGTWRQLGCCCDGWCCWGR